MSKKHLKGLIAAPFSPMHKNGSLNLSIIPEYYQLLKNNGVRGAFICGSTGEGVSLTFEEKQCLAEAWASCTASDSEFKVMTFLGGTCIKECKELAKHAQSIGLYGVSFTAPFYFRPSSVSVLAKACIEVAEAVPDMPFYYYHVPALNGTSFKMIELLRELDGKLSNFAGVKFTHEDFMDFLSCIHFQDGKYDMLWGRDECMLSALILGAKGSVGSTFNYAAPLYYQLIAAYNAGDFEECRKLQQKSIDMICLLSKYGGIATGKSYMRLLGLNCGEFRQPVENISEEEFQLFKADTEGINFNEFSSKLPLLVNI
jgi:N-acetylneuraminate lyase